MKVYFSKIFQLSDGYQEHLIDGNNFRTAEYLPVPKVKESINGLVHNDIYVLDPLSYFEIKLRSDTPSHLLSKFCINTRLLEAGLVFSGISEDMCTIYVYNCTNNHIYLKSDATIGEIK